MVGSKASDTLDLMNTHTISTILFTSLALAAFAANSILYRLALGDLAIDVTGFTIIRLLSGAFVLLVILKLEGERSYSSEHGSWTSGFVLFLYAITFSFAYVTLETGTGALILFGRCRQP